MEKHGGFKEPLRETDRESNRNGNRKGLEVLLLLRSTTLVTAVSRFVT